MAAKTSISVQQSTPQDLIEIHIKKINTDIRAVPPDPKLPRGHHVVFVNDTPGRLKIFMASSGVLDGLSEIKEFHVKGNGRPKKLEVIGDLGEHEYMVHFKFKKKSTDPWRKGFAIGRSSPRIVVIKPSSALKIAPTSAKKS